MITVSNGDSLRKGGDFCAQLESLLGKLETHIGISYKVYLNSLTQEIFCLAIERSKDNDFTVSIPNGQPAQIYIQGMTCRGIGAWFDGNGEPTSPIYNGVKPQLIELIELLMT